MKRATTTSSSRSADRASSLRICHVVAALTLAVTSGCVSSSTWSAWHRTAARLDELDRGRTDGTNRDERTPGDDPSREERAGARATATSSADTSFASCEALVVRAASAHPGLDGPRARARAALAMARAEGALPAPTASVATWGFPIGDPSRADRDGMYMLGAAQEVPPADALDASARASVEEASAALGQLEQLERDVATRVAHACADWAGAARRQRALAAWREVIRAMREIVIARLSAAGGSLGDVARVDRELATADRMIARTHGERARAEESLRAWLGAPSDGSLGPAPELEPDVPRFDRELLLAYALEHRGALAGARAETRSRRARAQAAGARAEVPTFMLGAMYMQAPQAPAGLGLEVRMTLPWLWSGEADAAEAARHAARASEADARGLERVVEVEVRTALAQLDALTEVLRALRTGEATAVTLALEASAAAYGAAQGSLLEWLDAARAAREIDVEEAAVLTELAHALTELTDAAGVGLARLERWAVVPAAEPLPPQDP